MAIWFKEFPLSYAQERGRGTLIEQPASSFSRPVRITARPWQRSLWSRAPRGAGRS